MNDAIFPLVKHAATTPVDEVPASIMASSRSFLIDTIGCILAGSSASGISELRETIAFWGGNPQATVLSFEDRTSAPFAAFLNAVMGHANDFDDTHDGALNHGCVTLVPALLATSEAINALSLSDLPIQPPATKIDGKAFLAALAIGLDISNRLGMAFIPYLHVGWLPTTLWGPFACAAACGRLLGLNIEQMGHAFGLAYSQIHANRQGLLDGALSKRIQPGFSASAGIQAAFFAARGLTGANRIVDGDFGLKALYSNGRIDDAYLSDAIGVEFETANVSLKPYPCCRCTHPVIDAALQLKRDHAIDWQDIKSGAIYLPPQSMGQIGNPFVMRADPTVDAQFSAQYTAALAFVIGWPGMDDFSQERIIERSDVVGLASRFTVHEFEKENPGLIPIEMSIATKTGKTVRLRLEKPKGSRENPMSPDEQKNKFSDCLHHSAKSYTQAQKDRILSVLDDALSLDDMTDLIRLL